MVVGPREVMGLIWALWTLSWFAAAFWAKRTAARADMKTEASYRLILILGFVALMLPLVTKQPSQVALPEAALWLFNVVALAGFGICWWARVHIGDLWSASITRKDDHKIIDTGPYAYVRHPIYTGVLVASLAAVLMQGHLVSLLGLVALIAGFYQKARFEEQFLRKELGAEAYDAYAARVPMLVPFLNLQRA